MMCCNKNVLKFRFFCGLRYSKVNAWKFKVKVKKDLLKKPFIVFTTASICKLMQN